MIVLWVELCPPRRDVEVLISVTCECDLIWKQGLGRCHQIKMKSLGRALIQYDQGLYIKKRRRSTWVKHHVKTETHRHNLWRWRPSWVMLPPEKKCLRLPEAERGRKHLPWEVSEGVYSCQYLDFGLVACSLLQNKFMLF